MNLRKNFRLVDFIFAAFNIFFFFGILFIFHPCAPKDDGTWMTCHYAGNMVALAAATLAVLSVINIFAEIRTKAGIFIASLLISAGTFFVPGVLVRTCSMAEMRCNSITRPATMLLCVCVFLCSAINLAAIAGKLRK